MVALKDLICYSQSLFILWLGCKYCGRHVGTGSFATLRLHSPWFDSELGSLGVCVEFLCMFLLCGFSLGSPVFSHLPKQAGKQTVKQLFKNE